MQASNTLTIKMRKSKHSQEFRRATVDTPPTFAAFQATFNQLFGPVDAGARLKFEDEEGDQILLCNDSDYAEALRVVAQSKNRILRVTVGVARDPERKCGRHRHSGVSSNENRNQDEEASPAPEESRCRDFHRQFHESMGHGMHQFRDLLQTMGPALLENPAIKGIAEGLLSNKVLHIVQPFICDNCNNEIGGDRYHSTTQDNFDLCQACAESPVGRLLEEGHKFRKVTALESLVETLKNGGSFDAFFAPGAAPEPSAPHHHAVCDVCNLHIVGVRHKCLDCPDYDECHQCYSKENKTAHVPGHDSFFTMESASVTSVPAEVVAQHSRDKEERRLREEAEAAEEARKKAEEEAARQKAHEEEVTRRKMQEDEEAARKAQEEELKKGPAKELSAFEKNLLTLESMGFADRKRNIQVLVRNRNKLFESIQELLNSSQ